MSRRVLPLIKRNYTTKQARRYTSTIKAIVAFDPSSSFMPIAAGSSGAGAVSSTPMAHSHGRSRSQAHLDVGLTPSDAPSRWDESSISASIESPLDRLDRGLRSLKEDNANESHIPSHTSRSAPSTAGSSSSCKTSFAQPVKHAACAYIPSQSTQKTVTPKHLRKDWDGIVDLRSPRPLKVATALDEDNWTDSDDDEDGLGLPPGMSPPVTMDFARPTWKATRPSKPSSSAKSGVSLGPNPGFKVAQSPVKAAGEKNWPRSRWRGSNEMLLARRLQGHPQGFLVDSVTSHPPFRKLDLHPKPVSRWGRHVPDGGGLADASANSSISTPSLSGYSNRTIGIESSSEMEGAEFGFKTTFFWNC